MDSMVNPDELS